MIKKKQKLPSTDFNVFLYLMVNSEIYSEINTSNHK